MDTSEKEPNDEQQHESLASLVSILASQMINRRLEDVSFVARQCIAENGDGG